ncbi:MAG: FMN-binding protein, partial [Clostridia bacterium]|nr:FMN-binding protein [Clostridia bacterium]
MNNMIVKLGIRLFLFCAIAAIALAITNEVTKGPIAEQALASKMAALRTVMPGCTYEEAALGELEDDSELDELFVAKNADGSVSGYAITASPQGYGGEIPITFGVSNEGYVTQVYVGSLQETAGLGSKVGEAEFKDQFIGIAADDTTLRNDVDMISGASISSGAFLRAAEDALQYSKNVLNITPAAGDKDAILAAYNAANGGGEEAVEEVTTTAYSLPVKGFDAFNVNIEVDSNGKIVSVSVPEHNETAGFGADLIADSAVFEALAGQDVATAQIDVRTGATLTSNAINEALALAADKVSGNGGAAVYDVTGFAPFKVAVELDDTGKIVSVSVPEHEETPGLGADLIADTAVFEALAGKDIADAQIDVRAGVTLTSNAINDALKQAAKAFGGDTATAVPGDPYTVKGMNKFTIYIELDGENVKSVTVPEHNETPGLGADMLTEEALSALVGSSIADAKVDTVSGVTLTSAALNQALQMAATANGVERSAVAEVPAAETMEAPVQETADPVTDENAKAYEVTGFQAFAVNIGVDENGKITSVTVPKNDETPGFGADLIADSAVFEGLVGKDIADAQIDVRAGATLTSNAINDALKQAAAAFGGAAEPAAEAVEEAKAETEPAAEETREETVPAGETNSFEVTGFQAFTVDVTVDENGKSTGVTVPKNDETPGFGADLI